MDISIKLEVDNVEKVLREKNDAVKVALENIGIQVQNYATLLCPVGTPESTGIKGYIGGTLRDSITHELKGDSAVVIGTDVKYAAYVEFGTCKMSARPYLKPAVEEHMDEYKSMLQECLQNA